MKSKQQYYPIKSTYIALGEGLQKIQCMLYEPVEHVEKERIGVLLEHSDEDYLTFLPGAELAKRGYRVLCSNVKNSGDPLDEKLLDVKSALEYLRQLSGIQKVILLGHSGGATLMSAYQNVAENGVQTFQGPEKIIKCSDIGKLPAADGVMLLDSNWGNGAMTLFSLDPAVTNEDNGQILDPELDIFDPANGYSPEGSTYTDEFIRKFLKAQGERNNRLIDIALKRLHAIEIGKGKYADDEPYIIPGGVQIAPNNKLFPQDIRLMSHTKNAWPLLHADGSITTQIIPCVRKPKAGKPLTNSFRACAIKTTIRTYLSSSAVRTTEDYGYNEDSVQGIDWTSSYCCTPGNIMGVSVPLLVMGMTGSYEYLASETIYHKAKSADKTLAFVEGASHNFITATECENHPGQFGDTAKTLFDFVGSWLEKF